MTLRSHTVKVLNDFAKNGGNLIFMGRLPQFINAQKADLSALLNNAKVINRSLDLLLKSIGKGYNVCMEYATSTTVDNLAGEKVQIFKECGIAGYSGYKPMNLATTTRIDGFDKWMFFARLTKPQLPHSIVAEKIIFKVDGCYSVTLYDTFTGEINPMPYKTDGETTEFYATLYDLDSLLVKLSPCDKPSEYLPPIENAEWEEISLSSVNEFSTSEPNVLLLDMARYSVDGGALNPKEEIMRLDSAVRKGLGLDLRKFKVVQPWAVPNAKEDHIVRLEYDIESQLDIDGTMLALEHPHNTKIWLNGESVDNTPISYFVDKEIKTIKLPTVKKGQNKLVLEMTFGLRTDLEACYLIGDFATHVNGQKVVLTKAPKTLAFGDVCPQGFNFYGGNIEYHSSITLDKQTDVMIQVPHYRGALVEVCIDDKAKKIIFPPFSATFENVEKGEHKITFRLFGTRYNTFSALHNLNADKKRIYIGPDFWRSENEAWDYGYHTRPMGILATPTIKIKRK